MNTMLQQPMPMPITSEPVPAQSGPFAGVMTASMPAPITRHELPTIAASR